VGRVGLCVLYVCDNEECDHGVGASVNVTMVSETVESINN
jgi:hypothetical protein